MERRKDMKPDGMFLKMDWDELFLDLSDESVGRIIKNAFNYVQGREQLELDKTETLLFRHTIKPVIDYNLSKYKQVCEHNAAISQKGVEAKKKKKLENDNINPSGSEDNPPNPSGFLINPDNPKDKDRVKDKDIDKEKSREKTRADINKMKKLVEMNLNEIKDDNEINFCIMVKELVKNLSLARFELLIFSTPENKLEELLIEYESAYCLPGVLSIREKYPNLLDAIIK